MAFEMDVIEFVEMTLKNEWKIPKIAEVIGVSAQTIYDWRKKNDSAIKTAIAAMNEKYETKQDEKESAAPVKPRIDFKNLYKDLNLKYARLESELKGVLEDNERLSKRNLELETQQIEPAVSVHLAEMDEMRLELSNMSNARDGWMKQAKEAEQERLQVESVNRQLDADLTNSRFQLERVSKLNITLQEEAEAARRLIKLYA